MIMPIAVPMPVAIAAPKMPIFIGKMNSQSRNTLMPDATTLAAIANFGDPSSLTKNSEAISRPLNTRKGA